MAGRYRDAGRDAQQAAEAHLAAVWDAFHAEEEGVDPEEIPENPAVGPFDGCDTCEIRETLAAAWPILLADAADMVRRAGYKPAAAILQREADRIALPDRADGAA